MTLLRQLTSAGARAYPHAGFDAAGLSITHWLTRQAGTVPWLMGAAGFAAHAHDQRPRIPRRRGLALQRLLACERGPAYEEQVPAESLAAMRQ